MNRVARTLSRVHKRVMCMSMYPRTETQAYTHTYMRENAGCVQTLETCSCSCESLTQHCTTHANIFHTTHALNTYPSLTVRCSLAITQDFIMCIRDFIVYVLTVSRFHGELT